MTAASSSGCSAYEPPGAGRQRNLDHREGRGTRLRYRFRRAREGGSAAAWRVWARLGGAGRALGMP